MQNDFKPELKPAESVAVIEDNTQTKTPNIDSFITPDHKATLSSVGEIASAPAPRSNKGQDWRAKLTRSWHNHRKRWIVGGAFFILFSSLLTAVIVKASTKHPVIVPTVHKKVVVKPTTVPSILSGLPVAPELNQRVVTGVMVENSPSARPQSGLSQAGVVFEAIAEGGITRFLALFQDTNPSDVGPIRSARPYYEQWALTFNAGYAHVGGSPEALSDIRDWGVRDLDQYANGGSYHRIDTRDAPHNVYTSIAELNQLETSKGYTPGGFNGFVRKTAAPSKLPTAKTIDLALSGPLYNVHYDYNPAANGYSRSEGGEAHTDASTNTPIMPKVVVALVMPYGLEEDGYHSAYNTIGSGAAYIFQDGLVTIGQWSKPDNATQFSFTDAAGKVIGLNPGQTWVTALRGTNEVSYAP